MAVEYSDVRDKLRVPMLAAIVMLALAAFGRWPYGFYQLLRLIVCGASVYAAVAFHKRGSGRVWPLIGIAILFNPIAPIRLAREDWQGLNVFAAAALALIWAVPGRRTSR